MIERITAGVPVSAGDHNRLSDALDDALFALFGGKSPLLFLPLNGSPSFRESGMGGLLFTFGAGARRIITDPEHDQDALDLAAATLPLDAFGGFTYDHTRKHVTLDTDPSFFDFSLRIQKREVHLIPALGGDQDYWVRVFVSSLAGENHFYHEHRHELAAVDVVFEGHTAREFTWPAEWDKFDCIRFHNLDPDPVPLVVTMEGAPDFELELGRWACVTVRRLEATWERQGFCLWRSRDSDVERFGGTLPWNDRIGALAQPWVFLREADAANNVASAASMLRWLGYFSALDTPHEGVGAGEGLVGAFNRRTGLWFDLARLSNRATVEGLPSAADNSTKVWRLSTHGGSFILARYLASDPATPVVERHTADLDDLIAGGHASGLRIELPTDGAGAALFKLEGPAGVERAEFAPVSSMITGGIPVFIEADGSGATFIPNAVISRPNVQRLADGEAIDDLVLGVRFHSVSRYLPLVLEGSGGAPPPVWSYTVGQVRGWRWPDGTDANDHGFPIEASHAWDGRRLSVGAVMACQPFDGAHLPDGMLGALLLRSIVPGDDSLEWSQISAVAMFPGPGGVWFTPDKPRRIWSPILAGTHHPHTVDVFVAPDAGDWRALSTLEAPLSEVARLEPAPGSFNFSFSCSGIFATDSAVHLSTVTLSPTWWTTNLADIMAGNLLAGETRPVLGVPLMHHHYNAFAARLNALREVVPFTFLDAQWYGRPFRPSSSSGIYGGHIYPGGHLVTVTAGSEVEDRADDLSVPVLEFSIEFAHLADVASSPVFGVSNSSETGTHAAFDSANLWEDLFHWFKPDTQLANGDFALVTDQWGSVPPAGWAAGHSIPPISYGFRWYKTANPEAAPPVLRWLSVLDVEAVAAELGIPFVLERFGRPYRVKIWMPERAAVGARRQFGLARTQAMLVVDTSGDPEFVEWASFDAASHGVTRWAPYGTARLAKWHPYPAPAELATTDAEVVERMSALDQGMNRATSTSFVSILDPFAVRVGALPPFLFDLTDNPSHGDPSWDTWWHNGGPFTGEAPRIFVATSRNVSPTPAGWHEGESRLMALPVPASQWGAAEIETSAPPPGGPRWLPISDVAGILTPEDLATAAGIDAWGLRGGWQVGLWTVGCHPPGANLPP